MDFQTCWKLFDEGIRQSLGPRFLYLWLETPGKTFWIFKRVYKVLNIGKFLAILSSNVSFCPWSLETLLIVRWFQKTQWNFRRRVFDDFEFNKYGLFSGVRNNCNFIAVRLWRAKDKCTKLIGGLLSNFDWLSLLRTVHQSSPCYLHFILLLANGVLSRFRIFI